MANHTVKIVSIHGVTHNVRSYTLEKPAGFTYKPGQAADVTLTKSGWENEQRPFTFTSLPGADHLEFTIKSYMDHNGVTNELYHAEEGDALTISDAWGAIEYKGEGVFIAGGAGITPFIAILRDLYSRNEIGNNQLYFSNKTTSDIILKEELQTMLGDRLHNIISNEKTGEYLEGRIDKTFLQKHITNFKQHFYVCGPDAFNEAIIKSLEELGAAVDSVVFEK